MPKWETELDDRRHVPVTFAFSSNMMVVKLDTGDLLPSGKTALEVTHDQESERRIRSGVEDDWAEPWRAV